MQASSASRHADDSALLAGLADDRCVGGRVLLDGARPAYVVLRGCADVVALPRPGVAAPATGRLLGTVGHGAVVPSSTALGAWQLMLVPHRGAAVRALLPTRLRELGYGSVAQPSDGGAIPAPRAVSRLVAALAAGIDMTLAMLATALRGPRPPAPAAVIRAGQIVSLDAGSAVRGGVGIGWVRVAGGHAHRNGEQDEVFGGAEPVLLGGEDWLVVDGPSTAEVTCTADLLAGGQLPVVLDQYLAGTLRAIDRRFG